tara:strand:+ start:459 stop:1046 length:588 start_codon:yes stop_codon:yes gene_type:complete
LGRKRLNYPQWYQGGRKTVKEEGQFGEPKAGGKLSREADSFDRELIQEHNFKYMSWEIPINYDIYREPSNLEVWDFRDFANRNRSTKVLVGHYQIDTQKNMGFVSGFTHFDYIHMFERKIILTLQLEEDLGSDNNYGLEDVEIIIPEQIYYFNDLKAGYWVQGEVQPTSLSFKIDLGSKTYRFDEDSTEWDNPWE